MTLEVMTSCRTHNNRYPPHIYSNSDHHTHSLRIFAYPEICLSLILLDEQHPEPVMPTKNILRDDSDSEVDYDALVSRIRDGEQECFEVIVRRLERPIRSWLATRAGPAVDVDEIAQRSFVVVYTRLGAYELGTNFPAWVFSIARFQLMTEQTRIRRLAENTGRYGQDLLQLELERHSDEPPELEQERLEHLETCVHALEENLRQYITWRYVEGITLEEMARKTGRSVGAIKKQLWQIRRKLQEGVNARMKINR